MKRILMFLFIISLAPCGQAMVNMRNASYNEKWVDYIDPGAGIEMKIERFYSSRSLFIGMFGYGWCSKLETHLTITSDGILNLTECGGGLEVTYYPNNFDSKNREHTIDSILTFVKKQKKMNATDVANFKTQLKQNTKMRFEYANRLGLVDDKKIKKSGNTFFSRSKGYEKIIFSGKEYIRKLFNGVVETYNKNGKLIRITEPTGEYLELKYKGQDILKLIDNKKRVLSFKVINGRVHKISNGNGLSVSYKYSGDNLIEVNNMWSKIYGFTYDQFHNMTRVDFPDKTTIKMTYDTSNDWIDSYTNRKKCREDFHFSGPKDHYWGTFKRKCPGSSNLISGKHEFWYKSYVNGQGKYLDRVLEEYGKLTKDVNFHAHFGRPIRITETADKIYFRGFSFYDNGFVNIREDVIYRNLAGKRGPVSDWNKAKFNYDRSTFQIDSLALTQLNPKGKITKRRNIKVAYNQHGLLSKIYESGSKYVKIEYDNTGRVAKLSNQVGEMVKLTHQVGIEKPIEIELVKVGKVKIAYNDQGEVASVESVGKRNIASSIIEKFLEMVTFLGPLGEEMAI